MSWRTGGVSSLIFMAAIINFVQMLVNTIQKALTFLASIPGMITAAISSFFVLLGDLFGISRVFSPVVSFLDSATGMLDSIVSWTQDSYYAASGFSGLAECVKYVVSLDSLVSDLLIVFSVTFGVVVFVFFSFVSTLLTFLLSLFVVRGIQKLISIFSAGYVKT